ncbi:hypothetical protein QQF73_05425 [Marinobacter sp. M216]|uniref:Uncharacterized protein n=1 Tax=Marinobacter albus TaxID=3030833 RepID=A0ABT7HB12_9GAMM|nr:MULTISPECIES: hypothetical protein [unclassified Marinobacter]MBW7470672.1 hypothetical protein [Marinobacter sp. F4218]MDK9557060.1 hypothetical protein [Marinobacter sp. M216]
METDPLLSVLDGPHFPLLIAALALLVGLAALWVASSAKRTASREVETLRQRTGSLGREVDELRVGQFNGPDQDRPGSSGSEAGAAKYQAEKDAYDQIWPQLWILHDRLGMFLRAVENGESAGDLRLEARNAALEARNLLNRNRPFCSESVEELVTRLIDTEIKAHLAACQHLDMSKEVSGSASDHERRVLRDKCHALYDGEARDLMSRLAGAIRNRVINVSYP